MVMIFLADGYGVAADGNAAEALAGFYILQVMLRKGIVIKGFLFQVISFDMTPIQMRKLKRRSLKKGMLFFPQAPGKGIAYVSGDGMKEIRRCGIKIWTEITSIPAYRILKNELSDESKNQYSQNGKKEI